MLEKDPTLGTASLQEAATFKCLQGIPVKRVELQQIQSPLLAYVSSNSILSPFDLAYNFKRAAKFTKRDTEFQTGEDLQPRVEAVEHRDVGCQVSIDTSVIQSAPIGLSGAKWQVLADQDFEQSVSIDKPAQEAAMVEVDLYVCAIPSCPCKNKAFGSAKALQNHRRALGHLASGKFQCGVCKRTFTRAENFHTHVAAHAKKNQKNDFFLPSFLPSFLLYFFFLPSFLA